MPNHAFGPAPVARGPERRVNRCMGGGGGSRCVHRLEGEGGGYARLTFQPHPSNPTFQSSGGSQVWKSRRKTGGS